MTTRTPVDRNRALRMAGALVGLAVALGACTHTDDEVTTASIPDDYRQRHPIAIQEANQLGRDLRRPCAAAAFPLTQRADVMGLAQIWLHEGTGAIIADVPVDTPNARGRRDAFREIQALLAAAGVPPRGITVHRYHPDDPRQMAAIRLNYPKIVGGGRTLRPVAGGSRPLDQQQELSRKQVSTTISAAPISATWRR